MSLEATEVECAANATAPRVALADIEAAIGARYDFTAEEAIKGLSFVKTGGAVPVVPSLALLSICVLVMNNGFVVIGKSAPASAENFNAELGRKLAYEEAIRQLWPLMGFALRDRLAAATSTAAA